MDFLKDIVKEIGDDYTQLASDISDDQQFIDTGSLVLTDLYQVASLVGYLIIRSLQLLESLVLEILFSLSPLPRTFLIIIPMLIHSISILRVVLLGHY